jgi:nucleoside-diphosphate-sugar epimerase
MDPAILITGATGYVGGRLLRHLEEGGHAIRCFAREPARQYQSSVRDWRARQGLVRADDAVVRPATRIASLAVAGAAPDASPVGSLARAGHASAGAHRKGIGRRPQELDSRTIEWSRRRVFTSADVVRGCRPSRPRLLVRPRPDSRHSLSRDAETYRTTCCRCVTLECGRRAMRAVIVTRTTVAGAQR